MVSNNHNYTEVTMGIIKTLSSPANFKIIEEGMNKASRMIQKAVERGSAKTTFHGRERKKERKRR